MATSFLQGGWGRNKWEAVVSGGGRNTTALPRIRFWALSWDLSSLHIFFLSSFFVLGGSTGASLPPSEPSVSSILHASSFGGSVEVCKRTSAPSVCTPWLPTPAALFILYMCIADSGSRQGFEGTNVSLSSERWTRTVCSKDTRPARFRFDTCRDWDWDIRIGA